MSVRSKNHLTTEQLKVIQIKKYCGDLKSGLVWISNGPKKVGLQMVRILKGSEILKPNYLKSSQMAAILSKTI